MKPISLVILMCAITSPAFANTTKTVKSDVTAPTPISTSANVPTGIDVSGCTWRRPSMEANEVCEPSAVAELARDGFLVQPYTTVINPGGGGGD